MQRAFLNLLADRLPSSTWTGDNLQTVIFNIARITPIKQQDAFKAIYTALFGRELGPRAGNLFEYLDCDFLVSRFKEVLYQKAEFWLETGIKIPEFEEWLQNNRESIVKTWVHFDFVSHEDQLPVNEGLGNLFESGLGVIEVYLKTSPDEKVHVQRLLFDQFEEIDLDLQSELEYFNAYANAYLSDVQQRFSLEIIPTIDVMKDIFVGV